MMEHCYYIDVVQQQQKKLKGKRASRVVEIFIRIRDQKQYLINIQVI